MQKVAVEARQLTKGHHRRGVRLFRNGRNRALRIPRELGLDAQRATIRREGETLVIESIREAGLFFLRKRGPLDEEFDTDADDASLAPLDEPDLRASGGASMTRRYTLDTNALSAPIRAPDGIVGTRIDAVGVDAVCCSVVLAAERRVGVAKRRSSRLGARVEGVLARMRVLPLSEPADAIYDEIRAELERRGRPIGPNDFSSAAITPRPVRKGALLGEEEVPLRGGAEVRRGRFVLSFRRARQSS